MSESMADFEKEIDESLKTLNVVENEERLQKKKLDLTLGIKYSSI